MTDEPKETTQDTLENITDETEQPVEESSGNDLEVSKIETVKKDKPRDRKGRLIRNPLPNISPRPRKPSPINLTRINRAGKKHQKTSRRKIKNRRGGRV